MTATTADFAFPTVYQEFIALSRYSRYIPELGRRETWPETVDRLISFWRKQLPKIDDRTLEKIREYILHLKVMPSMRSLMTAGPALERDHVAAYNCSYASLTGSGPEVQLWDEALEDLGFDGPITVKLRHPIAFDELFYVLLCGTGAGFSAERQFVNELPTVGNTLDRSLYKRTKRNFPGVDKHELSYFDARRNTIHVADSKYGWASALRILIVELYNGNFNCTYDVSNVRPSGATLKTFGGRASGPEPLVKMFNDVTTVFKGALGRKLSSIEAHDVMCYIASAVVVGGVRRSALIGLSNLSDDRMRHAKSGEWWNNEPQRILANNSVAYSEKPAIGTFMREWQALYDSKSGERGIFNRQAAQTVANKYGRDGSKVVGTNPCFAPGTMIQTKEGHFPIEDLVGKTVEVWDGSQWVEIDNFRVTGTDQEVWKITLQDGSEIVATPYHTFITEDGDRVKLSELMVGDRLAYSDAPETHGVINEPGAYAKGFAIGDGTHTATTSDNPLLWLYEPKYVCESRLIASIKELPVSAPVTGALTDVAARQNGKNRRSITGLSVRKTLLPWCTEYKNGLPRDVFNWTKQSKLDFLAGLFDADGTASDTKNGFMYQLTSVSKPLLLDVQLILKTLGIKSKIALTRPAGTKDFGPDHGGVYNVKDAYRLTLSQPAAVAFAKVITFERLTSFADKACVYNTKSRHNKIASIEVQGVEPKVYCCTVSTNHKVSLSAGIVTGQCGEIALRDKEFCNLTSVVVRPTDTLQDLMDKVEIAAILGTMQATLTNFVYLSPKWRENCEEERLLGVSMSGGLDHPVLKDTNPTSEEWLETLRNHARSINEVFASKLGINAAAATTCCKPEGTSSQMNDTASGLHPRFSPYYMRRVRADEKDPLAQVMLAQGFPCEPDVMQPSTLVFWFPVKAPETAVFRDDRTAIQQLEYWMMWRKHWCDGHNPSVTIYVKEHEWLEAGAWVYKNFDDICGLSFLPHSEHTYRQAPYEEITEEEYDALVKLMPTCIDYEALSRLETSDRTTGMQEYACSAGVCDLI